MTKFTQFGTEAFFLLLVFSSSGPLVVDVMCREMHTITGVNRNQADRRSRKSRLEVAGHGLRERSAGHGAMDKLFLAHYLNE